MKPQFKIRIIALSVSVAFAGQTYAESVLPLVERKPGANAAALNNPIDPDTKLPAASFDPYSSGAFESLRPEVGKMAGLYQLVSDVVVTVDGLNSASGMLPADGLSQVPVKIKVLDAQGNPIKGKLIAKIKADGVKIAPHTSANEVDKLIDSIGKRLGQDEVEVKDGEATFNLVAPSSALDVLLSVTVGKEVAKGKIAFAPDVRPLIAAGVVEGIINIGRNGSSAITPSTGLSDGFERELRRWQRTFDGGDISLAGRTTFFVKGTIKGEYLLTAMYDSEKNTRSRVLKDINPDKYYPVMGDSAQRGYEAKSSERLYVRVDNGKSYVLYGDFQTGSGFSQALGGNGVANIQQRNLGQYNRTMTGVRIHREDGKGYADGFAMRESLRQAVEEYRGNGTSGPYSVSNAYAVEYTDKLEVVVRDRNNLSRILSITPLARFVDYTFEPFSGRVLLKAALPSYDSDLNPVSLRITYEVDTGGEKYWVYGVAGQRQINEKLEVGGSYVKDENPSMPIGGGYATTPGSGLKELRELISANVGVKTSDKGKLVLEMANATSATSDSDVRGNAVRFDWAQEGMYDSRMGKDLKWDARVFGGFSEKNFNNPASSYTGGKIELGARGFAELTKQTRVLGNFNYTVDQWLGTDRSGQSINVEHKLTPKLSIDAGVRHVQQSEGAVLSLSSTANQIGLPGSAPVYAGSGLNPAGSGFWGTGAGLNPVTGQPQTSFALNGQPVTAGSVSPALDATTVRGGAKYLIQENWSLGVEAGQDYGFGNDRGWSAINTDYRYGKGRVFARVEAPTGRAAAGGDYRVLDDTTLYGRWEQTNGLASSYALDNASKSQAIVMGVRQADGKGSENYSEMRERDGFNRRDLESATGVRNTFPITEQLKANVMMERLKVFSGGGRSATALGGGLEYNERLWSGSARLEWRQLDKASADTTDTSTESWMNTLSLARKIDDSWTGLFKNYLLVTDSQARSGEQVQNRFQVGAAYRPAKLNNFDALLRYENKYERNSELAPTEQRFVNLLSANGNYHPSRPWWLNARVAAKSVDERLAGVDSNYQAFMGSGRIIYDVTSKVDVGLMASVLWSPQGRARQYAYGAELGYIVQKNVWASVGYNFSGFTDRDLTGSDYTMEGLYVRLRMKFDEKDIHKHTKIFRSGEDDVVPLEAPVIETPVKVANEVEQKSSSLAQMEAMPTLEHIEIQEDTLFGFNLTEIDPVNYPVLDKAIRKIKAQQDAVLVLVTGHSDRIGSDKNNLIISERRSEAVKQYLKTNGVSELIIKSLSKGPSEPLVYCENKDRALLIQCLAPNRRVTIDVKGESGQ
jgi:outer membrane protein OmpA-like peptidoglycan-associated protein